MYSYSPFLKVLSINVCHKKCIKTTAGGASVPFGPEGLLIYFLKLVCHIGLASDGRLIPKVAHLSIILKDRTLFTRNLMRW